MTYKDYLKSFNAKPHKLLRALLEHIEDSGPHDLEDSNTHNDIIEYFNKHWLHKKFTEEEFIEHFPKKSRKRLAGKNQDDSND